MIESTLRASLPGNGPIKRYSRLRMMEEIAKYSPAVLFLKRGERCVEITLEMFFALLRESGIHLNHIPWEITVPRPGWIVLIPRIPGRRPTSRRSA